MTGVRAPVATPRPVARRAFVLVVVTCLVLLTPAQSLGDLPAPVVVQLDGWSVQLLDPLSVDELLDLQGVRPATGRLLDIHGGVLDLDAFPGLVLRNGSTASLDERLAHGDDIELQHGQDQVEPIVVEYHPEPSMNPLYSLDGGTLVRRGTASGIVDPVQGPPLVALTFDDGPDARFTEPIVDILNAHGVQATFFVVGRNAALRPGIVERLIASGMSVQVHTWDHISLAGQPAHVVHAQLASTQHLLTSLGADVRAYRPPNGSYNRTAIDIGSSLGMRTAMWTVDPLDWQRPSAPELTHRVLSSVRPGSIVLLHDGGGDRTTTVEALPAIIEGLRAAGYQFVTL